MTADRDAVLAKLDQGRHALVGDLRNLADQLERLDLTDAHELMVWLQSNVDGLLKESARLLASLGRES